MIQALPPKQILYIDEQPIYHSGLDAFLKKHSTHVLTHCSRSVNDPRLPESVDLAIIEITSTIPQGIAAVRELKNRYPETPILVLSSYDECIYADRCLKAGARGFIMKSAPLSELKHAIETACDNELYVSERIKTLMINRLANPSSPEANASFHSLSDRELLIVEQIGLSKNNKEIAQALQISVKTIESHRSRIKAKLQLNSPQDLMRYALRMHYF